MSTRNPSQNFFVKGNQSHKPQLREIIGPNYTERRKEEVHPYRSVNRDSRLNPD
ncbi:MAG: hypothetical protein MJE68_31105 [Proteobacteria bacterium]|nr:hypothetical protein [Pseudomonadota bacterium]